MKGESRLGREEKERSHDGWARMMDASVLARTAGTFQEAAGGGATPAEQTA